MDTNLLNDIKNKLDNMGDEQKKEHKQVYDHRKYVDRQINRMNVLFGVFLGLISILSFVLAITWFLMTLKTNVNFVYDEPTRNRAKKTDLYKLADHMINF